MPKTDPLKTYENEHQRAERLEKKCEWLLEITDGIYLELCPDKEGTWKERAKYALEAAKKIGLEIRQRRAIECPWDKSKKNP